MEPNKRSVAGFGASTALRQAILHHQSGHLQQAEGMYQAILRNEPSNANALHLLGVIALQVGKHDIAINLFTRAIQADPMQSPFYKDLAGALREKGNLDDAAAFYCRAIEINPTYAEAHNNLGVVLMEQGRLGEAVSSYRRAIEINPDYAKANNNLGVTLHQKGKLHEAAAFYRRAVKIDPNYAMAHYNLAVTLQEQGSIDEAAASYRRALEINPNFSGAYNNLGVMLQEQGKLDEAVGSYRRAIEINPDYAEAYSNLGSILNDQGRLYEAAAACRRAIEINPDYAEAHNNLGVTLQEQGKLDEAVGSYRRAIEVNPTYAEAHHHLSKMIRHSEYSDEIKQMEYLLERADMTGKQRMHLSFGLGKAFEDLGQYEKAFNYLLEANKIKRSSILYDIAEDEVFFENLKLVFNGKLLRRLSGYGHGDRTPIFIVGMPRSGTTLVEQILATHHEVYGAGELNDLQQTIQGSNTKIAGHRFPDQVKELNQDDLFQLGADYINRIRRYSDAARYITDKMTRNFVYIGMIGLILPGAKVIHCKRDPMDTCLSCFKNHFVGVKFTYDLVELGTYYRLYQDLMEHWHSLLPGRILDVKYEELVSGQETQTRRILEYCDLSWEEACLSFFKTDRPVRTASSAQVRRPIYKSSVHLWKKYENELEPLLNILKRSR